MSTNAVASSVAVSSFHPIQQAARGRVDKDGDEATESTALKAKESAKQPPTQPTNSNLGKHLNVSV